PAPATLSRPSAWPDRVTLDHNTLVFANDCGCNDALVCRLDTTTADTIAFVLATDPARHPMCNDCFPMVPARCELPPRSRAMTVTINGVAAFVLPADAGDGSVWDHAAHASTAAAPAIDTTSKPSRNRP